MLIAEVGLAHEGSLGLAMSYAQALKNIGVPTVKYQMHLAEAESSPQEQFRVPFSAQDSSRQEYWRRTSFSLDEWKILKQYCDDIGIEFLCSPFSVSAVEWLEELEVARYKLGSAEAISELMLRVIEKTKKPVIISSGLSGDAQIDSAIKILGADKVSLMYCVSSYPSTPEEIDLKKIEALRKKFGVPVGMSDHSGNPLTALLAVYAGADIIEVHAAFDKRQFGPDSMASLELDQLAYVLQNADFAKQVSNAAIESASKSHIKSVFSRALSAKENISAGEVIRLENLEIKKPSSLGIDMGDLGAVVGKRARRNIQRNEFLTRDDICE